jgi:hypothetical protein
MEHLMKFPLYSHPPPLEVVVALSLGSVQRLNLKML